MTNFYPLIVKDIIRETEDCVSLEFESKEEGFFDFKAGQYLTFETQINGEAVRRSYSLSTAPSEHKLRVAVKQIPSGLFSTYANTQLKVGDEVKAMLPLGNFVAKKDGAKHVVLIAAGSGITPILSIAKDTLLKHPESQVSLLYTNKDATSVIYKEEIEYLKNEYMDRFTTHFFFTRESQGAPIYEGRMDANKMEVMIQKFPELGSADEYFLCGPEEMILSVSGFLKEQSQIDASSVHFELFTTSAGQKKNVVKEEKVHEAGDLSTVVVRIDEYDTTFKLAEDDENILDAAMEEGADLPFSCKGGVCCTCKAKVIEGEVSMDVNYALEADEVEAGYVLACQAHPKSAKVVLDFDV